MRLSLDVPSVVLFVVLSASAGAFAQQPAAPPPPPPAVPAPAAECVPACRSGFFCHQGQCLSRCNPPCGAGQQCLDSGECALPSPTAAQPYAQQPPPPPAYVPAPAVAPVGQRVARGWATGAGIMGIVTAGTLLGATALIMATNGTDLANYLAAATVVLGAVLIPIVAAGAGSGRWDPSITGSAAWRVVGWISYGITVSLSAVAVALGFLGISSPDALILALGGMGAFSALSFTADAFITAGQGRALLAGQRAGGPARHRPLLALAPTPHGGVTGLVGWAVQF